MKLLLVIIFLAAALSIRAQTVATTANVLHPIMKDPNHRYAPTSLDQDPSLSAEFRTATPTAQPAALSPAQSVQPVKPAEIVARIDASLSASPISLLGTVNGLKGKIHVTNIGTEEVTPQAQFAVCDPNGFKIGSITKTGLPLAPNDTEKIDVLATNLNAADLKLMKLTAGSEKK